MQDTFSRPTRPARGFRPFRFLSRLLVAAFVLSLLLFGWFYASNKAFRQTVAGLLGGVSPRAAFGGRDAITLMVLGKDEDRDNNDQLMKTRARSDTIILARLDFRNDTIQLLSVPRDTRAHIPGTSGYSKINAAHAIGGPELTARTLQSLLGVSPDASLVVDYKLLEKVVDDLGGVTVHVDKKLDYDDDWGHLHIHLKPGTQTLNGRQALGFVRFRHSNEGGGDSDLVRIQRQQQLVQAVKAKLREPGAWLRLPSVLETVRTEMRGTLTYAQLVALANFARGVPKEQVAMHVLPSHPGRVFVMPDLAEDRALAARLFPASGTNALAEEAPAEETPRPRRRRRARVALRPPVVQAAPAPLVEAAPDNETPQPAPAPPVTPQVTVEAAPDPPANVPAPASDAPVPPAAPADTPKTDDGGPR